jgi:NAD(P)H-quinone oxidoreductase subunit 5
MAMFVVGIGFIALAGSIEVLFVGWELLGLSSALLVGFFHERKAPVNNALHVFAVYRLSDAAMLAAAVLVHRWVGSGSLVQFFSADSASTTLGEGQALAITLLLVVAVAGKSALWPLSGWLPRAMEGPTPSSAVYYGALSIHAGCYLLLRAEPLFEGSDLARVIVGTVGVTTCVYAAITARVQTDVKSAISYAALTQVGLIVVEIALGLRTLAFLHIAGHACFRLLQFLSAPNVLHDLHELENRLDGGLPRDSEPPRNDLRSILYFIALERGFADSLLDHVLVRPFRRVVAGLDRFDRFLVGNKDTSRGPR